MDDRVLMATKQWTLVQPVVSAFVGAIVRDFAARDDVLQEIAVAILESYDHYDASRPFQAWALGIARNHIRTYLRRQKRDRLTFDEKVIASLADTFDGMTEETRALDRLHVCVSKLDTKALELLDMRYSQDLKPAAIAERIKSTPNNIAKALQRIRDVLRDCVRKQSAAEAYE